MKKLVLMVTMALAGAAHAEDGIRNPVSEVLNFNQVKVKSAFAEQRAQMLNQAKIPKKADAPEKTVPKQSGDGQKAPPSLPMPKPNQAKASDAINGIRDSIEKTNRTINVESGENSTLYVSQGTGNRIRTPFKDPFIHASCVQTPPEKPSDPPQECVISTTGGVVTYQTVIDRPVGVFITPKNDPNTTINLSIRALKTVPPQDVKYEVIGYEENIRTAEDDKQAEKSDKFMLSDYHKWINNLTVELVNGEIPSGYSEIIPDNRMYCDIAGFEVEPGYILNGGENRIDVYKVSNQTDRVQIINEAKCYRKGVRFIFAYPDPELKPGEASELFIVRKQPEEEYNRRSRLVGGEQ